MIASIITLVVAYVASGIAIHHSRVQTGWQWVRVRLSPAPAVTVAAALYVIVVGGIALLRHAAFGSNALDMGLMDQVVWNSAHGRWFEQSFLAPYPTSFLGHHFSPALALLVPFYWLLPHPATLILVQIACIVGSALLLYRTAIRLSVEVWIAVTLVAMVLLHPLVQDAALFDFHQDAIGMFFLALGLYGISIRQWWVAALGWLVSLAAKEEIAVYWMAVGLFFGVMVVWQTRQRSWGQTLRQSAWALLFVLVNALWLYAVITWLIPAFQRAGEAGYPFFERYAFWGGSLRSAFGTLWSKPVESLQVLLLPNRIGGLGMMLLPVLLFLVGGRWPALLLLLPLGINSLADYVGQHNYRFHYSLLPIVIIVYACIWAIRLAQMRAQPGLREHLARATIFMAVASLMLFAGVSQIGLRLPTTLQSYMPNEHVERGRRIVQQIPAEAAVIAQNKLVAHLSQRRNITLLSRQLAEPPAYYLLDLQGSPAPQSPAEYRAEVARLVANVDYGVVKLADGYVLLARGAPHNAADEAAARQMVEHYLALTAAPE